MRIPGQIAVQTYSLNLMLQPTAAETLIERNQVVSRLRLVVMRESFALFKSVCATKSVR